MPDQDQSSQEQSHEAPEVTEVTVDADTVKDTDGASGAAPDPEVVKQPEPDQEDPADAVVAAQDEFAEDPAPEAPAHNPNALRGVAAGPAPHPRTLKDVITDPE